ncbi:MAG: HD-GYP domain-containing protein [Desulfovibrionaceae bacterium]
MSPHRIPISPEGSTTLSFTPVSPLLIRPWSKGRFSVFLRQGDRFVLYSSQGEAFTPELRTKLFERGIKEVYILAGEMQAYEGYLEENLGILLGDESIPLNERSGALYEASLSVVKDVFTQKLPKPLTKKGFERVRRLVEAGIQFLGTKESLKHMARLISQDYDIFHHSVNVMVLTTFLLQAEEDMDAARLINCGIGAILHDIGKARMPKKLLDKRPETLSREETDLLRTHPNLGIALSADVPLAGEIIHCILFHHENEDGSGYPSGLKGPEIPRYVKALSVCNLYDNLTTATEYRQAKAPFEALQQIKARQHVFEPEMIKRLILVLANAEIV